MGPAPLHGKTTTVFIHRKESVTQSELQQESGMYLQHLSSHLTKYFTSGDYQYPLLLSTEMPVTFSRYSRPLRETFFKIPPSDTAPLANQNRPLSPSLQTTMPLRNEGGQGVESKGVSKAPSVLYVITSSFWFLPI